MEEINGVVKTISEAIENQKLSYDNYSLLLQMSGVSEDDAHDFFAYTEDGISGGIITGIAEAKLKKNLALDEKFLKELIANLPKFYLTISENK